MKFLLMPLLPMDGLNHTSYTNARNKFKKWRARARARRFSKLRNFAVAGGPQQKNYTARRSLHQLEEGVRTKSSRRCGPITSDWLEQPNSTHLSQRCTLRRNADTCHSDEEKNNKTMKMCDIWAITPALNFLVTKTVIRRHENEKVANVLRIERGRGVDVVELAVSYTHLTLPTILLV